MTVLEVEYPLVEKQLDDIDTQILKAEKELNWNSEGESPRGVLKSRILGRYYSPHKLLLTVTLDSHDQQLEKVLLLRFEVLAYSSGL